MNDDKFLLVHIVLMALLAAWCMSLGDAALAVANAAIAIWLVTIWRAK